MLQRHFHNLLARETGMLASQNRHDLKRALMTAVILSGRQKRSLIILQFPTIIVLPPD